MELKFKFGATETTCTDFIDYLKYICNVLKNTNAKNCLFHLGVAIAEAKNDKKDMDKWKLVPPDGGWGWLVLFGSTLVNVLVPGTVKSFGVLFVEFLEAFEATPSAAMWIPALCYFLYSSLGNIYKL